MTTKKRTIKLNTRCIACKNKVFLVSFDFWPYTFDLSKRWMIIQLKQAKIVKLQSICRHSSVNHYYIFCLKTSCISICCLLFSINLNAQISSTRVKTIYVKDTTVLLDTLPVLPGSLKLLNDTSQKLYQSIIIDYSKNSLSFDPSLLKDSAFLGQQLQLEFQVLSFNFKKTYFKHAYVKERKDLSLPVNPATISYNRSTSLSASNVWNDQLNKSGSIIRGINFGNNQNLAVNSNLNLQVSGKINNELELLLSATDNNIPIQPEGSSLQLQEFDQVYVQLRNKKFSITAGDFQLSRPTSYFLNYYKRARGINVTNILKQVNSKKDTVTWSSQLSGAVSRGRFARNVIQGIEGNQGPYRLRGSENELFIIILSGTEKIYLDGRLLQRGQENDYIIDYNSSELIFTAKQQITKDKRIIAEFQYSEKNYARTLLTFNNTIQLKKQTAYFHVYSEQDNKNRPLQQELDSAQKQAIRNVGDILDAALVNGFSRASFNASSVLYFQKDSLVNGISYKLFSYASKDTSDVFQVRFSFVGEGKGNYRQSQSLANGKVYEWMAPINGIPQGSYEPVIKLISPKLKQMFVSGFQQSTKKAGNYSVEAVMSRNDINLYSSKDKQNDIGSAVRANYAIEQPLSNFTDSAKRVVVGTTINYEYLNTHFSPIERFRSEEFERDWNRDIGNTNILSDNHFLKAGIYLMKPNKWRTAFDYNLFSEGRNFLGNRYAASLAYQNKRANLNFINSYAQIKAGANNSFYYKHVSSLAYLLGPMRLQLKDNFENNYFTGLSQNVFYVNNQNNGFRFWEKGASIGNKDTLRNNISVFYKQREDQLFLNRTLKTATLADNAGAIMDIRQWDNHPFKVIVNYRDLRIQDSTLSRLKPDNSLLGRIEYHPSLWRGFLQADIFYENGGGLEQKREFRFVEVPAGQGNFTWIDYNNNNIKELNEFENAIFNDQAKYIRVFVQSNEYIKVFNGELGSNLRLTPANLISDSSNKLLRWLKRFDYQANWITNRKTTEASQRFDLLSASNKSSESTAAYQNNIYQGIFFNKSSAIFSAQYILQYNEQKQLLFNGGDERRLNSNEVLIRYNPIRVLTWQNTFLLSNKINDSKAFTNRNYNIKNEGLKTELIFQTGTKWRISAGYKYTQKQNEIGIKEKAVVQEALLDFKYNQSQKGSLLINFSLANNDYNAPNDNSTISFEMLNGLSKGQNYLWGISYRINLNSYLQVNVNYNGRQVAGNPRTIHTGGIQAGAYF
jgi:hypothetical protein